VAVDGEPPKSPVTVLAFENVEKAQAAFAGAYRDASLILGTMFFGWLSDVIAGRSSAPRAEP
jgi:hypothetical protein